MTELKRRRSLTNVGGDIEQEGDREASELLAHAIAVVPTAEADAPDRAHVHGFHAYPARTHPVTARRLVEAFSAEGATILDPFCGSGTVLVEAMLAGRAAVGTDLNPIAVMLARAKTFPRSPEKSAALVEAARGAAAVADARRKAKSGAVKRLPQEDVSVFAPHVLLELDGIRAGIAKAPAEHRPELGLVLSSILIKLSEKRGDTSDEAVDKRVSAGYPARLFVRKAEELARRFDELAASLPSPPPRARVFEDDATLLTKVRAGSIDAVVTSPPYVATYDYLAHHALRMRWLGLDQGPLAKGEVGARRRYERRSPREARSAWMRELSRLFDALARVTVPGAPVVLLIADSATSPGPRGEPPEALRADELVAEVARAGGHFDPIARASQRRPHFHAKTADAFRDKARAEHALLLHRASAS
jgi:DNA modification methylase